MSDMFKIYIINHYIKRYFEKVIIMKILFLTHNFPNKYNPRQGIVILRQAKELIKLGHEVVVVSPKPYAPPLIRKFKSTWLKYNTLPFKATENNITVYRPRFIKLPTKNYSRYSWKFIQLAILSTVDN